MSLLLLFNSLDHVRVTQACLEVAYFPPGSRVPPNVPPSCWPDRARRLRDYFAPPFDSDAGGALGTLLSAVARELTGCSRPETVTGDPVRSGRPFQVTTRFGPLTAATGVFAVDAGGQVTASYPILGFDDRTIFLSGAATPLAGDRLVADYSYQQEGIERRVQAALAQLNLGTAGGEFLEAWGAFFGVMRLPAGTGLETDGQMAARILDRVQQSRNTETAIIAAVRRLTGGHPYLLSWFDAGHGNGFVFNFTPASPWMGGGADGHLIWGKNARFLNGNAVIGGQCVFEVWIPAGSPYSDAQILNVVNMYKAAGTKAIIRHQS